MMTDPEAWAIVLVQLLHFVLSWFNHRSIERARAKLTALVENGHDEQQQSSSSRRTGTGHDEQQQSSSSRQPGRPKRRSAGAGRRSSSSSAQRPRGSKKPGKVDRTLPDFPEITDSLARAATASGQSAAAAAEAPPASQAAAAAAARKFPRKRSAATRS
jgi:cytoskeletal protein RodZ